jgi:hypothetical protein
MKTLIAIAALIVALLAWLFPFQPSSPSPFVAKSEPPSSPSDGGTERTRSKPSTSDPAERERVIAFLQEWIAKVREHDLNGHMACYADILEPFYKKRARSSSEVWAEVAPAFSRYSTLDIYLSDVNVNVDSSGTHATATFVKTWNFQGEKNFSGVVRQLVWLIKREGRWLISGIKEQ